MGRCTLGRLFMIFSATFTLTITSYTNIVADTSAPEKGAICGGIAGIQFPEGYYCNYPEPYFPDAQGVCKKIDYCTDPKNYEEWTRFFRTAPENETIIRLFALRIGLCKMVDARMISLERAIGILEQERAKAVPKQQ
jgi:hypothetical protein